MLGALAILAPAFAFAAPAAGQGVDKVQQMTDLVSARREEILDACGRLRPLVLSGTAGESTPIQVVLTVAASFDSAVDGVSLVGEIVAGMKSPEDLTVAHAVLKRAARRAVESANDQIDFINANLHSIKTPAAVTEATLIRNAMVAIRDAVKPFTTRE